ncbi:MAG: hypothetical protein IPN69_05175 [Acidobacteria bacterium]|nr:hypothetical protein [Acidobacteriota bacterium]
MRLRETAKLTVAVLLLTLSAFAQNRQDIVDDGFTWFEAYSTTELQGNNIPTATGWTLKYWVRVIGNYPDGSGLKFVVTKAGRTVFSTRCGAWAYRKTANDVDESFLRTAECWQGKSATKETGEFEVGVFVVNGATNQEQFVRTYKIDVRTVARVPSGQGAGTDPPRYYINRHNEAPVSFIFVRPSGYIPYFDVSERPERSGANHVELHFSLSPSDVGKNIPHGELRCTVNGKALSMPGPMPYATQVVATLPRWYREIHQDRLTPKYKAGLPYEEEIRFQMVRMTLPLTWGNVRDTNRLALEDYKGNWVCTVGKDNEVWRTLRWTVVAKGLPELHPEQRGNINLGYNTYLVDTEIPTGGSLLDERLNGPSAALFYGQPWTTTDGRAMAARVPKKGNPFPIPSNQPNQYRK